MAAGPAHGSPSDPATATGDPAGNMPDSTAPVRAAPDTIARTAPAPVPIPTGAAAGAAARDPRADATFAAGLEVLEAGRVDSALALFTTAIHLAPSDERAYRALVRVHDRDGSYWEAARTLELLALRFPDEAAPHAYLGEVELLRGRQETALIEFDKALRIDPHHPLSLAGVARCRAALGDSEASLAYFDKLLRARPHDPGYRYGRAVALGLAGETKAAATQFKWAIRLAPRSWLAERDYARLLSAAGERLDLAIRHYERAVELLGMARDPATASEVETELAAVRARHDAPPGSDDAP